MARLFTISHPFQITLLCLSIFDLENVIDAKPVVTFKGYIRLTSCFQCLHKQLINFFFRKMCNFIVNVLFSVAMETCIPFLFSAFKV